MPFQQVLGAAGLDPISLLTRAFTDAFGKKREKARTQRAALQQVGRAQLSPTGPVPYAYGRFKIRARSVAERLDNKYIFANPAAGGTAWVVTNIINFHRGVSYDKGEGYVDAGLSENIPVHKHNNHATILYSICQSGIHRIKNWDVEGIAWDDTTNAYGQRIHAYPAGGIADPMAVANGMPTNAVGTDTCYAAIAFNFNNNQRRSALSGAYDGTFTIDVYGEGLAVRTLLTNGRLGGSRAYDNNSIKVLVDFMIRNGYGEELLDFDSLYKSQVVCAIDPATLPGVPASFASIVRKGKVWEEFEGGANGVITQPEVFRVYSPGREFRARPAGSYFFDTHLLLSFNGKNAASMKVYTGGQIAAPQYFNVPTTGITTFRARGKRWQFDWLDIADRPARFYTTYSFDGITDEMEVFDITAKTIDIADITEVGNPLNTGDRELYNLRFSESTSLNRKAANVAGGITDIAKLQLYECNILLDGTDNTRDSIRDILRSMNGALAFEAQGKFGVSLVHPTTNAEFDAQVVMNLTDRDIVSFVETSSQDTDAPEFVAVKYYNEELDGAEDQATFPGTIPIAGLKPNVLSVESNTITDPYHADARAEYLYRFYQSQRTLSVQCQPWCYKLNIGDFITVTSEGNDLTITRCRVDGTSRASNGFINLSVGIYNVADSALNANPESLETPFYINAQDRVQPDAPVLTFVEDPRYIGVSWQAHDFPATLIERRIGTGAWETARISTGTMERFYDLPNSIQTFQYRINYYENDAVVGLPSPPASIITQSGDALTVTVLGSAVWKGGRDEWMPAGDQNVRIEWVRGEVLEAWAEQPFRHPYKDGRISVDIDHPADQLRDTLISSVHVNTLPASPFEGTTRSATFSYRGVKAAAQAEAIRDGARFDPVDVPPMEDDDVGWDGDQRIVLGTGTVYSKVAGAWVEQADVLGAAFIDDTPITF